jgi:hypothetical protein
MLVQTPINVKMISVKFLAGSTCEEKTIID